MAEIKTFLTKIIKNTHKEVYVYIFISFILVFFSLMINGFLAFIFCILSMWCIYFFRDPERVVNSNQDIISSPADGVIVDISNRIPPEEIGINEEMQKVSIFLNVFNVHVNRSPVAGLIEKVIYHKGKFLNAGVDKASEENERNTLLIDSKHGKVAVVQIAGLIARRIICDVSYNQNISAGERYGIIKFGSRVDLYLPLTFQINVLKGQSMVGGETIIATKK